MLLNGWKEIAKYLGRGIRMSQRWVRLGLPVIRVGQTSHSPVLAYSDKLDNWLNTFEPRKKDGPVDGAELRRQSAQLRAETRKTREQTDVVLNALRATRRSVEANLAKRQNATESK